VTLPPRTTPTLSPTPALTPTFTPNPTQATLPQLKVHYIDVGQGDSILLDLGATEVLIDGGDGSPGVVSYLQQYVDGPLEAIVATHPHADHIGGLGDVLDHFIVEQIWLNGGTSDSQTYANFMDKVNAEMAEVHYVKRGDKITIGNLLFEVLHPTMPLVSDTNDNSIVLELSFGEIDFLFTGDAGATPETSMLIAEVIEDIDILKVSHHGSKYGTTANFLDTARPEVAIISVGNNTYGHPAPETVARLTSAGATIYRTDINRTIVVATDGITYTVKVTN
jgi:beta-lactamase superfamily II metal-dependent hydrolase